MFRLPQKQGKESHLKQLLKSFSPTNTLQARDIKQLVKSSVNLPVTPVRTKLPLFC